MLNATNNILHSSIESTLSIDTFPHAELLLTYMIIFEPGNEHSCKLVY